MLTDAQIIEMRKGVRHDIGNWACTLTFARAIEQAVIEAAASRVPAELETLRERCAFQKNALDSYYESAKLSQDAMQARIDELEAGASGAAQDAKRYQWLLANCSTCTAGDEMNPAVARVEFTRFYRGSVGARPDLGAAIDEAVEAQQRGSE